MEFMDYVCIPDIEQQKNHIVFPASLDVHKIKFNNSNIVTSSAPAKQIVKFDKSTLKKVKENSFNKLKDMLICRVSY